MADEADIANDYAQVRTDAAIQAARGDIPAGEPGECVTCGTWSARLVSGSCAPCRDEDERLRRRTYATRGLGV